MAGIDIGGGAGKRELNKDINMIPFIDLLMVTIMFLLITAVWVTHARVDASAQVPGEGGITAGEEKNLHVYFGNGDVTLAWKSGATSLSERHVAWQPGDEQAALAAAIAEEWRDAGRHRDPDDRTPDRCVLHTGDRTAFKDVVQVLDAVYSAKREVRAGDGSRRAMSVFQTAFAVR